MEEPALQEKLRSVSLVKEWRDNMVSIRKEIWGRLPRVAQREIHDIWSYEMS